MTALVIVLIYGATFVGCNGKLQSQHKAGFFVALAVIGLIGFLLAN